MQIRPIAPADQLVLHAALSKGKRAEHAWRKWRANFDFDQAGPRHAPLIPLLHQNLIHLGIDDPLLGKLKGIQRRRWYENQLKLLWLRDILRTWQDDGINAICLPQISLVVQQYADMGMRSIQPHLLIPASCAIQAVQSLKQYGWRPKNGEFSPGIVKAHHHCAFTHPKYGGLQVSWHLFPEWLRSHKYEVFWREKKPLALLDVSTFALDPTDQLLYICLQIVHQHELPLWVADALTLLRYDQSQNDQSQIDWQRFCAQCAYGPRLVPTLDALSYLSKEFDAPIPSAALSKLRTMSVRQHSVQFARKWVRRIRAKQRRVLQVMRQMHS